MDAFQAAMIADGEWELAGIEASEEAFIEAYQHLIDTGAAWSLQGGIGRQAADLIKQGLCTLPPKEEGTRVNDGHLHDPV